MHRYVFYHNHGLWLHMLRGRCFNSNLFNKDMFNDTCIESLLPPYTDFKRLQGILYWSRADLRGVPHHYPAYIDCLYKRTEPWFLRTPPSLLSSSNFLPRLTELNRTLYINNWAAYEIRTRSWTLAMSYATLNTYTAYSVFLRSENLVPCHAVWALAYVYFLYNIYYVIQLYSHRIFL